MCVNQHWTKKNPNQKKNHTHTLSPNLLVAFGTNNLAYGQILPKKTTTTAKQKCESLRKKQSNNKFRNPIIWSSVFYAFGQLHSRFYTRTHFRSRFICLYFTAEVYCFFLTSFYYGFVIFFSHQIFFFTTSIWCVCVFKLYHRWWSAKLYPKNTYFHSYLWRHSLNWCSSPTGCWLWSLKHLNWRVDDEFIGNFSPKKLKMMQISNSNWDRSKGIIPNLCKKISYFIQRQQKKNQSKQSFGVYFPFFR